MRVRQSGLLKIKIALLFALLIAIAFSINWEVAMETIRGEKIEDVEKVLHHILSESVDEYISEPLDSHSDLSFLYAIPHNQMILHDSEVSHLQFLISKTPYSVHQNTISASIQLRGGLYLNAISDDLKVRLSVHKYGEKLIFRYIYSLLTILLISIFLLHYYMKPLGILARKTRDWKNDDPFEFSLNSPGKEIEEVSDAFSALIRRLEGFRTKEKELFKEAAHELKTPLALMRSRLDVYESSQRYEKTKFVTDLGKDIERLTSELKNVLFLESSDFEDPVSLNINTALQNIVDKVDILAKRKKLFIQLPTQNFTVITPEKLLNKVLTALIENAMTYATENSQIDIEIDQLSRTITIANSSGDEKYLFSSKIGHKMLLRLSEKLDFTYEITQYASRYAITLKFS